MMTYKWLGLVLLLMVAIPVLAHNPRVEDHDWGDFDQPYVVAEGDVSYAFFGYLSSPEDRDVFQIAFAAEKPTFKIQDFVPVCGDHYTDFVLDYVLLGDSVTTPKAYSDLTLPFDLPEKTGIIFASAGEREALPKDAERPFSFEFHTQRNYYNSSEHVIDLPGAGTYWLVVYNADGKLGDYLLGTGYAETFFVVQESEPPTTQMSQTGFWPHRNCDLPVSDAKAIINVKPETLPQATPTALPMATPTTAPKKK